VPQSALLGDDRIRAFVTHAGSGSTQEAIWFGKPMLCIPLAWDQYYNARVVELLGAGLRHTKSGAGRARLGRKLAAVASDPGLAERSSHLSDELRRAGGTEPILALIRDLVSATP
jgi:UDP:flavonoid glycosyltransferase YjiC (YdhE family)